MLVAAAAMAFFACQKQEVNAPEMVKVEGLSFSAEKPEFADASKTEWTGETIQWSEGDKIRVAYTAGGVWQNGDGTATADEENGKKTAKIYASNSVEAGETASFSVPGNFTIPKGVDLEFYGVYPSTATSDASMPYAPSVTVTIPAEQKPLANSFDSKGDLMAAKSVSTYILSEENPLPEAIPLMWTRLVAHGHLTLKNLQVEDGEKLQTITLTADKDADMVGEHYLYLDTHNVEKAAGNNAANSLTVKADNLTIADGGNVTFWTCFRPCTWKSLDVVVETDKATYTRSIDLTGKEKTFKQNARNTLAINMAEAEREAKISLSLPFVRDFSDRSGSSEITELDGFSSIDGKVYNAENAIRLASGNDDGSITTQPLDLSQNFHVIVTACGWDSGELKMTVSAGEQTENITLTTYGASQKPGTWKDYVINFDPVGPTASVQFSAVKDTRYYIQKIQILEGHAELTPVLSATNPDEMSAEGGEGSFTYTLSNPKEGKEVSATVNVDWIENLAVNQEAKTVSYNVAENTSEESRTATITLSYDGAQSVNVTVTQKGKTAEGGETEPVWTLVTDASTLAVGDQIVIVASSSNYALGTTQNDNNRNAVSVTKSGNTVVIGNTVQIITLETGSVSNTFAFNTGTSGYLYAASSSNNYLRTKTTLDANGSWSISITTAGVATIKANGTNTRNLLKKNSSSALFSCYGSGQSDVSIYRLEGGESGDEEPKPAITVSSEASVNVEAAGATGTVSYTLTNAVADAKVSAQANQTWVTIGTITSTSVPFTVSENTGEQRTATITLSYDGAESKTVNITQAAAQSGGGETLAYTVTYTVTSKNTLTVSGTSPSGSSATLAETYSTSMQMTSGNSQTYTLSGYDGCTIKGITMSMKSNSRGGAGTLSVTSGSKTIASIGDSAFNTSNWYGSWSTSYVNVSPQVTPQVVGSGEKIVVKISATANSLYCQSITVTYESTENGGETPDPNPEPTTYTYTFTSKAWADATSSWTSGKDGGQMQSGRGVQVSTTYTGANATCKTSMSNIQKVVFVYSTNSSNGAGSIKVSIGNQEKTLSVTKTGGTSDRNLEFDFSDSPLSGQLKFTVTCTTNSIYIKSVSITAD